MIIGLWGTIQFFMRRTKIKGSIFFFAGFFMIVVGFTGFTIIGF